MNQEIFQAAAGLAPGTAARWWPHVEAALFEFGILQPKRAAAWLAQVGHESLGFTRLQESFDYKPEALVATFGRRMPADLARKLGRQPGESSVPLDRQRRIAAIVYAGRYGNGDAASGDGWRFSGHGLKQVTFYDNHLACSHALGVDLVAHPELLVTDDRLAARSAAWFWYANGCNQLADAGDFVALTRRINGGENGLALREKRWELAKRIING
ncbi:glycoside hydrolase family 19 protein [Cupriavidus necator]|uniref:glycoside hydrolase family 19 protein n=1 Tax=Cupriavidus necator TaxID=106590 RepID=UPI0039C4A133